MPKYLGETPFPIEATDYEEPLACALLFIEKYGQTDGDHHKLWVLDQVARICHGTPVRFRMARWNDGTEELRFSTEEPASAAYYSWVKAMRGADQEEYAYDIGVAPWPLPPLLLDGKERGCGGGDRHAGNRGLTRHKAPCQGGR